MKLRELFFLWTSVFIASSSTSFPLSIGSNTTPSRQAAVSFPRTDTDNTILGFAAFDNGFTLRSETTTCTYNGFFPVSGNVSFRGGRLHLRKELVFDKALNITTSGSIFAASNPITFGKLIPDLSLSVTMFFDSAIVVFNTGVKINSSLRFRNTCKINAKGKRLTFQGNGEIMVWPGGNLIIEQAELWGIKKSNLRCLTDRGALTLRSCTLALAQDYTFSRGSLFINDDVFITGTNKFIYSTAQSTTLETGAMLFIDSGITFSYQPRLAKNNLITMTDESTYLYLNGCTLYSSRTGLQLNTPGNLIIDDSVTFSSEARSMSEALVIGSNLNTRVLGRGNVQFAGLIRYD